MIKNSLVSIAISCKLGPIFTSIEWTIKAEQRMGRELLPVKKHNQHLFHGYLYYITFITHKNDVIIIVKLLYRATSRRRVAL